MALLNLGFAPESIKSLLPGQCVTITGGRFEVQRFAASPRSAYCFFEWIYFANVASTMEGRSVYLSRKALGEELARVETVPIDEDTIVVPVPDTSKAAADAMAFKLKIPSLEGLIRNRYTGRTFIEGSVNRKRKAETKYTPLREVLEGKKIFLVEDSIVRSTTMKVLLKRIRELGRVREIHVRVACPPIIAPCFYGIDMSTVSELFAPHFFARPPAVGRDSGRNGRHARRRLVALSARRVDCPGNRFRLRSTLSGLHHRRVSFENRPAALSDRAGQRRHGESFGGRTYETRAAVTRWLSGASRLRSRSLFASLGRMHWLNPSQAFQAARQSLGRNEEHCPS